MKLKHTPGPWALNANKDWMYSTRGCIRGGDIICLAPDLPNSRLNWEDNALLIMAAPDLLEALIELVNCDYTMDTHLSTAQLKAKTAIEKATDLNFKLYFER